MAPDSQMEVFSLKWSIKAGTLAFGFMVTNSGALCSPLLKSKKIVLKGKFNSDNIIATLKPLGADLCEKSVYPSVGWFWKKWVIRDCCCWEVASFCNCCCNKFKLTSFCCWSPRDTDFNPADKCEIVCGFPLLLLEESAMDQGKCVDGFGRREISITIDDLIMFR